MYVYRLICCLLVGGSCSSLSTPPSSPQPLSTSTKISPVKRSIKCEPIDEEAEFDQNLSSPVKNFSPTRRPLSPVTNTVNSPIRSIDSPLVQPAASRVMTKVPTSPTASNVPTSPRKSPRLMKSQDIDGKKKSLPDNEKKVNRIIAKPRKKKLYSTSGKPEVKLTVPVATTTISTLVAKNSLLGVSGLTVRKGRTKNNSIISELAGLPKTIKGLKRKRSKTSDSDSDGGKAGKKSKTSSSSEEDNGSKKAKRRGGVPQGSDDSFSEIEDDIRNPKMLRQRSPHKLGKFTEIRNKNEGMASKVPDDILQQEFESEYEESTLYLNTQSNRSKVWATTNTNTQPSQLSSDKVGRRRSNRVSVVSTNSTATNVASKIDYQKIAQTEIKSDVNSKEKASKGKSITPVSENKLESERISSPSTRTTRRRSIAVSSPVTTQATVRTAEMKLPPKGKGRRKSVAVFSPSVAPLMESHGVSNGPQTVEVRKTRRRSALVSTEVCQLNNDSGKVIDATVVSGENVAGRGKSVAIPLTVGEGETAVKETKRRSITGKRNIPRSPTVEDKSATNVEETPELTKSKPRRKSSIHTPILDSQPVDVSDKIIRTPGASPAPNTPLNRRRSMRVMAISNSMQKAGTPLNMYGEGSVSTIELAREKDATIVNEISVASTSNKCPADFDSTAEESLLLLAKRKKKKVVSSSQASQKSRTQQRNESTRSTDSGISHVDLLSASILSSASKSRKSIDEFRPGKFNISTQKKIARTKLATPSCSDIESSEEENKPVNSKENKSKKHKPQSTIGRKAKASVSDIASDATSTDANNNKRTVKSKVRRNSSKSSADSTCSSTSDGNGGKHKRRKRSSGSKSPKYPSSLVMTSLHYK